MVSPRRIKIDNLVRLPINTVMDEHLTFELVCEKCQKEFTWTVKRKNFKQKDMRKFCSRACANSRVQTDEMNEARRNKLIGRKGPPSPNKGKTLIQISIKCSNPKCSRVLMQRPSSIIKYCDECSPKFRGGFRENAGRAKHGYYKGIYCGSTYELVWVIYNLDHSIPFERFPTMLEHDGVRYIPDFLIGNTIHEIKGYGDALKISQKCAVAVANGYSIEVKYKKDIQYMFDYVENKYNTKKFYELYDEYAPKFKYVCGTCGIEFGRDKKSKLAINFCSRSCAGKHSPNEVNRDKVIDLFLSGLNCTEISKILKCNVSHLRQIVRELKLRE